MALEVTGVGAIICCCACVVDDFPRLIEVALWVVFVWNIDRNIFSSLSWMGMQMMMLVVLALGAHSLIEYEAHSVTLVCSNPSCI